MPPANLAGGRPALEVESRSCQNAERGPKPSPCEPLPRDACLAAGATPRLSSALIADKLTQVHTPDAADPNPEHPLSSPPSAIRGRSRRLRAARAEALSLERSSRFGILDASPLYGGRCP